jgi:hypothetical protein
MKDKYADIRKWLNNPCAGCYDVEVAETPNWKERLCCMCLLDAIKKKLRRMHISHNTCYDDNTHEPRNIEAFLYGHCYYYAKTELDAFVGAVRKMLKGE